MMRVHAVALPPEAAHALEAMQAQIDVITPYPERVSRARQRFEAANRSGNGTFDAVRRTLAAMCAGAGRCMYCEDSAATDVEHFKPKAFYPELVFVWLNYLYACGACNRSKRDHFRLLSHPGEFVDLLHRRHCTIHPPVMGSPMLLDPRVDDPMDYLSLDLMETFCFVPRYPEGTLENARAAYTIARLKLNHRDILAAARREAYGNYRARLREYIAARGTPASAHLTAAILRCGHPTVWAEMKTQSHLIGEIRLLFAAAPEAYVW